MKITITTLPMFHLPIDAATLSAVIIMSEHHYDGLCKQASMPGGFLFGWRNALDWSPESPVQCAPNQAQILLKICENTAVFDSIQTLHRVRVLSHSVRGAINDWDRLRSAIDSDIAKRLEA